MLITVEYVRELVSDIDRYHSHLKEDILYIQVLRHIAEGRADAQVLATEALKAVDINFHRRYGRWYR